MWPNRPLRTRRYIVCIITSVVICTICGCAAVFTSVHIVGISSASKHDFNSANQRFAHVVLIVSQCKDYSSKASLWTSLALLCRTRQTEKFFFIFLSSIRPLNNLSKIQEKNKKSSTIVQDFHPGKTTFESPNPKRFDQKSCNKISHGYCPVLFGHFSPAPVKTAHVVRFQ